jgi:hypothetical protein
MPAIRVVTTTLTVAALLALTAPLVAAANGGVDVLLTDDGPWQARLVGFDLVRVSSVVYFVRDARGRWRHTDMVKMWPFESPINWWEGDNHGARR